MEYISHENFRVLVDALSAISSVFAIWVLVKKNNASTDSAPSRVAEVGTQTENYHEEEEYHSNWDSDFESQPDFESENTSTVTHDVEDEGEESSEGEDPMTMAPIPIANARAGVLLRSSGMWDLGGEETRFMIHPECAEDDNESSGSEDDGFVPELISAEL